MSLSADAILAVNAGWKNIEIPTLTFHDKRSKLFFIRDAIQLCEIDGSYTQVEKDLMSRYASDFEISPDTLKTIENWV